MARKILIGILFFFPILFLVMFLVWLFTPSQKLDVLIIDKTVLDKSALEHRCLTWILNHSKFRKSDGSTYKLNHYYGFFPIKRPKFTTQDFAKYTPQQLDATVDAYDMIYFADLYGIYANEWYKDRDINERSRLVYGGMTLNELYLFKRFREQKKLVIGEYNMFASPTSGYVRKEVENSMNIRWTGWSGRYFIDLDTLNNPDLPKWVYRNYMAQNEGKWPFKKGGMVFAHEDETVVILDETKDLKEKTPSIITDRNFLEYYKLKEKTPYFYWFDILQSFDSAQVKAEYHLYTTIRGDTILKRYGIPKIFPAVIEQNEPGKLFYFAGDFADNPISFNISYFAGIKFLKRLFYTKDPSDRRYFFWNYYRPLVTKILKDYEKTIRD